jgi:signal transduction histidine kinase
MRSRSSHVRTKVVALLLSLAALWVFAATVTVREGLNLLWLSMLADNVGTPIEQVVDALQQERRASVVFLGANRSSANAAELQNVRAATDAAAAKFRSLALTDDVDTAGSDELHQRIADVVAKLDALPRMRAAVDDGGLNRTDAQQGYTDDLTTAFRIYSALATLDDEAVAKEGRDLNLLGDAREQLSQEDALLAGALAAGQFTAADQQQFTQLAGTQRYLRARAVAELPADDAAIYQTFVGEPQYKRFAALEDQILTQGRPGSLPTTAAAWQSATAPVLGGLRDVVLKSVPNALNRAKGPAIWVIVRLFLAGGLGLVAVIASVIVSVTTARSLVRQLERLRTAARELAEHRLPSVVARLQHGDEVDVRAEAPPLEFGNDEIGEVGQAFNAVQETAIRVAVEQAELRRGVRDVFLSLARRTQALVHRQLRLLDTMERRETNSEELEDLFRVDHLATRMRRNAENLIVLSGAVPGRGWRRPVPFVDVVRGALAEVEDYTRVTVSPISSSALAGRAVGDVIHLLAELIENAVSFSPPYTIVQVSGQRVANGFAVEIEDRGLGMSESDLAAANELVRNPPEFNLTSTVRLGLYVVSRLAQRHGIRVSLKDSPYGGTTAVVLVPLALVIDGPDSEAARMPGRSRIPIGAGTESDTADTGDGTAPEPSADSRHRAGASNGHLVPAGARHRQEPDGQLAVPAPRPPAEVEAAAPLPARTEAPPAPADVQGNGARAEEQIPLAPSGLPLRTRQASLAAPLREESSGADGSGGPGRPPEEIRRMMSSYQSATLRARSEADQVRQADEPDGLGAPDELAADNRPAKPGGPAEPRASESRAAEPRAAEPRAGDSPASESQTGEADPFAAAPTVPMKPPTGASQPADPAAPAPPAGDRPSRVVAVVPFPTATAPDDDVPGETATAPSPASAPGPTDPAPVDQAWPPYEPWSPPGNGVHSADPESHP